jgi:1-acyl-sn-glycerol-3-phosphate acyltransferase
MVNQLIIIRSLIFNILFFLLSTIIGLLFFPVLVSKNLSVKISSVWAKITLYMLKYICSIKINITGLENYPTTKVIFAARHESVLETILFLAYFPNIKYVLKKELLYIPFYGLFVWRCGHIIIDRRGKAASIFLMLKKIQNHLSDDESAVIFPHGTRVKPDTYVNIKSGIYALYKNLNIAIIPVYMSTGKIWQRNGFIKKPGTVRINFHKKITSGYSKGEFIELLNSKLN